MMSVTSSEFSLYVTTWGIYNDGGIGFYVDLADYADHEDFMASITEKLKNHKHKDNDPEWQFQDVSGLPDCLVNEDRVSPMVFNWIVLKEDDRDLLRAWIDATSADLSDIDNDLEQAQDDFHGKYESEKAAGEEMTDDLLNDSNIKLPDWIRLDYEGIWYGYLRHDHSYTHHNGEFWVFRN